jgi:ABC-type Fe3+-hydroxamate transport system substrate-binding protein
MNSTFTRMGLVLLVSALPLASGCASNKTAAQKKPETVTINVDPEETVTLPPATGSNIPRKVKAKDLISGDRTKKSQVESYDAEDLIRVPPGRQDPRRGGGGE